jgi:hypothetical protein
MGAGLYRRFCCCTAPRSAGLLFKSSGTNLPPYLGSLWWFVFGIVFALGAGFAAWWNFTFACRAYEEMSDHRMLIDRQYWPKERPKDAGSVIATLWIANISGILSVCCLIAGAVAIWCAWR